MRFIFALFICLLALNSNGQTITCDQLLDSKLHALKDSTINADSVNTDLYTISKCGFLDEIDTEILNAQMLAMVIVDLTNNNKTITYRNIIDRFKEFKLDNAYAQLRETVIISKKLENTMPSPGSFASDSVLLFRVGMPNHEIVRFKAFLDASGWGETTYKEAFILFQSKQPIQEEVKTLLRFDEFTSVENAKSEGIKNNKNILIYFSGYACANARKMEDRMLSDQDVKDMITANFVHQAAYVDSKQQLGDSTVGKQLQKIQSEYFKSFTQPTFYIIDSKGTILAECMYTSNKEEFINFLKKGIKK